MKQKGKRAGRRLASLLLAFAMIVGMLSGPVFVKQTAQAAGEGTIELGTLENHGTYYTYPDASVKMSESVQSKNFYDMSVMVNSGYFKIPYVEMDGIAGTGILADGQMDKFDKFDKFKDDSTANKYSAVTFSWVSGISKAKIEGFIRSIQFVTTESQNQVVSISATTMSNLEKQVTVDNQKIQLQYFNGHFYGYTNSWTSWKDAYTLAKRSDFYGMKGYLATVTSRAEDRFVLSVGWEENGKRSKEGWMGCTRAELLSYDTEVPEWKELAIMDTDQTDEALDGFIWRWVNGPEKGQRFGYQNMVGGNNHDGGFVTDPNCFSNWKSKGDTEGGEANNSEPNGGGTSYNNDEAFGYYGRYEEGRWNDNSDSQSKPFYIEFGGNPGDDEALKKALGEVIYTVTKDSEDTITDGTEGKEPLTGDVTILNKDPYQNCKVDTELEADITDILDKNASWNLDPETDLSYQWLRQDKNGVPTIIEGATGKTYKLVEEDLGNKLIVRVTVEKDDQIYMKDSEPYNTTAKDSENKKIAIGGAVVIEETGKDDQNNPTLKANIDGVTPEGVKPVLDYQWYIYNQDQGTYGVIPGATDPTYTVPEDQQGKQIVVVVTPNKETGVDYEGSIPSAPYTITEKNTQKEPIKGEVKIENLTMADDGKTPINKAGTILSANASGVTPEGAQPTLTYQWYVTDDNGYFQKIPGAVDKNYVLTEDDIDRKIMVTALADEVKYTGSVSSLPHDAARTNADVNVDPDPDTGNDGERIIKITPTAKSTGYIVWELGTENEPTYEHYRVTDKDGNPVQKNDEGYYYTSPGEEIWFYVEKNKAYDIKEKQVINTVTETLGSHIDDDKIKEEYDEKTDTINITVDPAEEDYQYAILKKIDGKYEPVTVSRDSEGNYVYDPNGSQVWTDGGDKKVDFTKLPADGTYRVVAIPTTLEDGTNPDDIDPSDIKDGSKDIDATKYPANSTPINDPKTNYDPATDTITIAVDPAKTDHQYAILKKVNGEYQKVTVTADANGNYVYDEKGSTVWSTGNQGVVTFTKLPADGTYRIVAVPKAIADNKNVDPSQLTTGGSKDIDGSKVKQDAKANQGSSYTKAEEDKAEKFIKDYVTDTKKKLITKVNDSTRDIIISGEATWKKMTAREKAAVNAKLKARGCPYTYEQLLEMAKKWKIPSFNMKKVMKKGTKSQIKMVKCKGATIVTTTSNKKVGTISKKGVIKAKKVGKAKLTITAIKGKYTNRLVIRLVVRKKFKNAKEIKKLKAKQIKTPTLLLNKRRKVGKSTKIGIVDLNKKSKVKYKSLNTKNFSVSKKGRYKAKRLGSSLIRTTVKQNGKTYILYLYLTGTKK